MRPFASAIDRVDTRARRSQDWSVIPLVVEPAMNWVRQLSLFLSIAIGNVHVSALCNAEDTARASKAIQSPLSPEQSLGHFVLPDDLKIELVASEPNIIDPVAVRFDEDGRMWVVEMRDYPQPLPGNPPQSRISILTDQDGDGFYETATVFADGLLFATGLQPWKGGAIVTVSGEILYLSDTDGDGKADQRETWFTGFIAENSQLRANHPRFALDNSIYVANGLRGGKVVDARHGGKPLSISSRDFRFDPNSTEMEAVSGVGQFGLTFDDFGNRFVCSNRNPLRHIVLEDRYLKLNPNVAVPETAHDVAQSAEASKVFPLVNAWTTSNLHAGQFTAACGVDIYRGHLLPEGYYGNSFTCEPTGSLVHREMLQPAGATFHSKPAYDGKEFLASRDSWFRPVNLETGPDGAMYVVDMYRAVIEHPDFMPDELKNRPDLRLGNDRGRIYRIVPQGGKPVPGSQPLSKATTAQLVQSLANPNAWQRETAARLLYERQDRSAVDTLKNLARTAESPIARVHALYALAGLQSLNEDLLATALADDQPRVQQHGAILAEAFLGNSAELAAAVRKLCGSDDPRVRFQAVLTSGLIQSADTVSDVTRVAVEDADDVWTRRAIAISAGKRAGEMLSQVLRLFSENEREPTTGILALVRELALPAGAQDTENRALAVVLNQSDDKHAVRLTAAALTGLAQGMVRRGAQLTDEAVTSRLEPPQRANLQRTFDRAAELAADDSQPEPLRLEAIDLLRHAPAEVHWRSLSELTKQTGADAVQVRAIAALATSGDAKVGPFLLDGFRSRTPAVRTAILDAVIGSPQRALLLLDDLKAARIAASELDPTRRERLLRHADAEVRKRAGVIFAATVSPDRQKVIETYAAALAKTTNPIRGKELFRKNCATCHKVGDVGVDVAPDISDSRVKTAEQYLTDILAPNRAIDSNYISYTARTVDGTVHTGVLTTETSGSITLRAAENKSITLLRQDIEELKSNGVSLMPEGFETTVPPQDMADLISYIKNWRYLDASAGK